LLEEIKDNRTVLNSNGSQISNFKLLKKSDIKTNATATVIGNPV